MDTSISFVNFAKKYWWLLLGLVLLLVIPVAVFCIIFWNDLNDISAWASMIAGIATYLGSAFLGVLVFYNSWIQTEQANRLDDINVIFRSDFFMRDGKVTPFKKEEIDKEVEYCFPRTFNGNFTIKDFTYVKFNIINNNFYTPVLVSIEGVYFLNQDQKIEKCAQTEICSNSLETMIIDYKTKVTSYYGVPETILQSDYYKTYNWANCIFVFKVVNAKGQTKYYVEDYWFAENVLGWPRVLTEKQYSDNMKKFGVPIEVTHFNRQLFKKKGKKI